MSIIQPLEKLLSKVLEDPVFRDKAKREGFYVYTNKFTGEDFRKIANKERELYQDQIKAMPVKPF